MAAFRNSIIPFFFTAVKQKSQKPSESFNSLFDPGAAVLKKEFFVVAVIAFAVVFFKKFDAVPVRIEFGEEDHLLLAVQEGRLKEIKGVLQRFPGFCKEKLRRLLFLWRKELLKCRSLPLLSEHP